MKYVKVTMSLKDRAKMERLESDVTKQNVLIQYLANMTDVYIPKEEEK